MNELLPQYFVGNVDVNDLSSDFCKSITSNAVDLSSLTNSCSRDGFRNYHSYPKMYLSSDDEIELLMIIEDLPSVPDMVVCMVDAVVMKAVEPELPQDRTGRIGTAYCILKVRRSTYS